MARAKWIGRRSFPPTRFFLMLHQSYDGCVVFYAVVKSGCRRELLSLWKSESTAIWPPSYFGLSSSQAFQDERCGVRRMTMCVLAHCGFKTTIKLKTTLESIFNLPASICHSRCSATRGSCVYSWGCCPSMSRDASARTAGDVYSLLAGTRPATMKSPIDQNRRLRVNESAPGYVPRYRATTWLWCQDTREINLHKGQKAIIYYLCHVIYYWQGVTQPRMQHHCWLLLLL